MKLHELFQRLSYGPMSNVAIGKDGAGDIADPKKPSIVIYANDALLRLHTRFMLAENVLAIPLLDAVHSYELQPEQGDFIKALTVFNAAGCPVPLNDEKRCGSYFTPQSHILQVPHPKAGDIIHVVYQARHPKLEFDPVDVDQEITLPPTLEEALVAYISYLHYSSMNGQENLARASEFLSRYNSICSEAEGRGVVNTDDMNSNSKLEQRGFI